MASVPNILLLSNTRLNPVLISDVEKECDFKDSAEDHPCSFSGCIDEYLADTMDADSAISCLNHCIDASQSLQSASTDANRTATRIFDKKSISIDRKRQVDGSPTLLEQAEEELQGSSASNVRPVETEGKQRDDEKASTEVPNVDCNLSANYASERLYESSLAQVMLLLSLY